MGEFGKRGRRGSSPAGWCSTRRRRHGVPMTTATIAQISAFLVVIPGALLGAWLWQQEDGGGANSGFLAGASRRLLGKELEPWEGWHKHAEVVGDPSPGLNMRRCNGYYGQRQHAGGSDWAYTECAAPFNQVCIWVDGMAELKKYEFTRSYQRSCHFRCPCNDTIPWEEWAYGDPKSPRQVWASGGKSGNYRGVIQIRWEKKCKML